MSCTTTRSEFTPQALALTILLNRPSSTLLLFNTHDAESTLRPCSARNAHHFQVTTPSTLAMTQLDIVCIITLRYALQLLVWASYSNETYKDGPGGQTYAAVMDLDTFVVTNQTITSIRHDMFCPGATKKQHAWGCHSVCGELRPPRALAHPPSADAGVHKTRCALLWFAHLAQTSFSKLTAG